MTSTCGTHAPRMEPDWARLPPHVPTYPNPPMFFRQTPAEKYTQREGSASYSKWWSKWHTEYPEWREEHYRIDPLFPVMRKSESQFGTTRPPFRPSWQKALGNDKFLPTGIPETEARRARGIYKTHFYLNDEKLYPWTNAMTSTQYKKPITGIYGPLLRSEASGLKTAYNRHGYMPSTDYYT